MYLVPYSMMKRAGLTLEDLSGQAFLGSHHNVALGVLAGDFAAGAVKEEVFLKFRERGLRSLAATMNISEHVFVASNRLSPKDQLTVQAALLNLGSTEAGLLILQNIKSSITGIVKGSNSDYDDLRTLLRFLDEGCR